MTWPGPSPARAQLCTYRALSSLDLSYTKKAHGHHALAPRPPKLDSTGLNLVARGADKSDMPVCKRIDIAAALFSAFFFSATLALSSAAHGQSAKLPSLPTSGKLGLQGSIGAGFTDFSVQVPSDNFEIDRGIFASASIERGFGAQFYLTLSLSNLSAEGLGNYSYTNLASTTTYTATDVKFRSSVLDLGLGLKFKLIDGYRFRPYIEAGGVGGYHTVNYSSKFDVLAAQGNEYKNKDVVMGSGYYGEAGIEVMFSNAFGVKLAARQSTYQTKKLETLANRPLRYVAETYYFSLLFGM